MRTISKIVDNFFFFFIEIDYWNRRTGSGKFTNLFLFCLIESERARGRREETVGERDMRWDGWTQQIWKWDLMVDWYKFRFIFFYRLHSAKILKYGLLYHTLLPIMNHDILIWSLFMYSWGTIQIQRGCLVQICPYEL